MTASNKLNLNWSGVEKALAEGTFSGYKIGIIETEKLFAELLKERKIPGRDVEAKIKYLRDFLSMPEKLDYGRSIYKKILGEPHFEISRDDTKKVIAGYWQAMIDIEEVIKYLSLWEKLKIKIKYFWTGLIKKIEKICLIILVILAIFLFLGETPLGQNIFTYLILISHWLILNILLWLAIALFIFYLMRGIIRFLKRTKKSI